MHLASLERNLFGFLMFESSLRRFWLTQNRPLPATGEVRRWGWKRLRKWNEKGERRTKNGERRNENGEMREWREEGGGRREEGGGRREEGETKKR